MKFSFKQDFPTISVLVVLGLIILVLQTFPLFIFNRINQATGLRSSAGLPSSVIARDLRTGLSNIPGNQSLTDKDLNLTAGDTDNFSGKYDYPPINQKTGTVRIPVLIYHHIGPIPFLQKDRSLFVTAETFGKQMEYLQKKQYKTLTMEEYYSLLKSGRNPEQKSVLLTFDDGYKDNYTVAFPELKKLGFTGIFFIPTRRSEITPAELQEMSAAGMEIESHSVDHLSFKHAVNTAVIKGELETSREKLLKIVSKPVIAFAYPYCVFDKTAYNLTARSSYLMAFKCGSRDGDSIDNSFADRYQLSRSWIYNDLENFIYRLSGHNFKYTDNTAVTPDYANTHYRVL